MLDLKFIREQPEGVKSALAARGLVLDLEEILSLERRLRSLKTQSEKLQAQRNHASETIARKKSQGEEVGDEITTSRELGEQIKALNEQAEEIRAHLGRRLLEIPNIPHPTVPRGPDASANQEIRQYGQPSEWTFTPKTHWELGEQLGILDTRRAAKIAGARFVVYWGAGAQLERALIQFMLDLHIREAGYTEIFPPLLVNRDAMIGTGQLPKLEKDMFRIEEDDLFLIPTAEVPVTNLHREEILPNSELPKKYVAYTPCFRREAGSYGKDTKGIVRQHQFNKVELVKIVHPEHSYPELESLVSDAEKVLQRLGLHYRLILLSTGDMSFASAKSYDLEVWHAGARRYWEVSSCSNFEAFQARRANIRFKSENGKTCFCHTLNGSGVATSRLLPAILENYQTEDGGINLPEVLSPYLNGKTRITPSGELIRV